MANFSHTYDATCLLHHDSNVFTRRASQVLAGPPPIKAHFFYCSSLPIDDPLLPVPPPTTGSSKPARTPPRPFSVHDNRALDEAWLRIHKPFRTIERSRRSSNEANKNGLGTKDSDSKIHEGVTKGMQGSSGKGSSRRSSFKSELESKRSVTGLSMNSRRETASRNIESMQTVHTASDDLPRQTRFTEHSNVHLDSPNDGAAQSLADVNPITANEIQAVETQANLRPERRRSRSPFRRKESEQSSPGRQQQLQNTEKNVIAEGTLSSVPETASSNEFGSSPTDRDTTGTPFLRIATRFGRGRSKSPVQHPSIEVEPPTALEQSGDGPADIASSPPSRATLQRLPKSSHLRRDSEASDYAESKKVQEAKVPVGVSRLHVVELPLMKMGPIYWDPVHDVSSVVRGTWFYKETMFPVESDLANQLEEGYEYIKPWTSTYQDELDSCLEFGPEAELKVAHKIWPSEDSTQDASQATTTTDRHGFLAVPGEGDSDNEDKAQTSAIVAAAKPENRAAGVLESFADTKRLFARSHIIFANAFEGQILTTNQLPSAARGRKPLAKIRKSQPVGVIVIRGFDYKAWEKEYAQKRTGSAKQTRDGLSAMRAATFGTNRSKKSCIACLAAEETPPVTDLVLVVHGIGQKLSERVESFHFTHAINAFRRSVNTELQSEAVKPWLREDVGNIMVLPVNWRSKTALEDEAIGEQPVQIEEDPSNNRYGLKDITAESLPAVRNLISDVLLDIPYYLSHHKPKMIQAVIREANRIYRLWCQNNPGFREKGRMHLIAHSLGSVMAVDILSQQPTTLPKELDLSTPEPRMDMLEFETKSLFFCGSPAGFFLLLNRATLLPRRGHEKPGAQIEDYVNRGVSGEKGVYGCMAVDNLYNVVHQNDPVAYRLNACVDVNYSDSLTPAFVPSATASWGQYFGAILRGRSPTPAKNLASAPPRPSLAKLPSTVEMETHNFTREEIAEKRMFLLNDNGQIDYMLRSGGGPLEIQYLNMLSAHSSYWILQDFVRFLVIEIGRKPGRDETVNSFKVRKKAWVK